MSSAEQIRAILTCALDSLFSAPLCDLRVISREQDFRDFPAEKLGRSRVVRCLEEAAAEAEAYFHARGADAYVATYRARAVKGEALAERQPTRAKAAEGAQV